MLTIGCIITNMWEGGDGSAQRGRSVVYDCLVRVMDRLDIVIFAHNRRGKGDANRAYRPTQSDSPGTASGAKSDVYDCLVLDIVVGT